MSCLTSYSSSKNTRQQYDMRNHKIIKKISSRIYWKKKKIPLMY